MLDGFLMLAHQDCPKYMNFALFFVWTDAGHVTSQTEPGFQPSVWV